MTATMGRPRGSGASEDEYLEHPTWTQDRLNNIIAWCAAPDLLEPMDREMLSRLRGELLAAFVPFPEGPLSSVDTAVELYKRGTPIDQLGARFGGTAMVERWIDAHFQLAVVQAVLATERRRDLKIVAAEYKRSLSTAYRVVSRFIKFSSKELAIEPLRSQCQMTHQQSGGTGDVPLVDRRQWSAGQCESCAAMAGIDRSGKIRDRETGQIIASRLAGRIRAA